MSGRLHVFFYPNEEKQLEDLVNGFEIQAHNLGPSHMMQCALEYVLLKVKEHSATLPEDGILAELPAIKELCDVRDPVNAGRRWCYLKQSNINKSMELAKRLQVDHHDFILQHFVQMGMRWVHNDWKNNSLPLEWIDKLRTVIPPKVVYHN